MTPPTSISGAAFRAIRTLFQHRGNVLCSTNLNIPGLAVSEYFFVAGDEREIHLACGSDEKAVCRIGMWVAGQLATIDHDGRAIKTDEFYGWVMQRTLDPCAERHEKSQAIFR